MALQLMTEEDDEPIDIFEVEDEERTDAVQYIEYEEVEYLDSDQKQELIKADSTESFGFFCTICDESFKTEFGIKHHNYFNHLKGQSESY